MNIILETERLILREFDVSDAQFFYELNSNPKVIQFTGDSSFKNIEEAEMFLEKYPDYKRNGYGRWAVIEKSSGDFLGWCGLKFHEDSAETDLGFRFFENYWNQGFATESAKACLNHGFRKLNIKSVIGRAMKENLASIHVLQKIGMYYERDFDFDGNEGVIYRISSF